MTELYMPKTQKGWYANIAAWVVGVLVLVALVVGVGWAWTYLTASTSGKVSAQKQIQSGSSRIAAYNHFFDLCASVQTLEGQLAAQTAALPTATGADYGRVQANIVGIEGARAGAIAQYNADARKGYTIGQFRSSQLPYQLATAPYTKGAATSCGA